MDTDSYRFSQKKGNYSGEWEKRILSSGSRGEPRIEGRFSLPISPFDMPCGLLRMKSAKYHDTLYCYRKKDTITFLFP